ncbi:MAG: transposase [Planctomycetota bacterium]
MTEITRELCGLDVSSTDVSRAASRLDVELEQWRTRPLGFVPYVVLDARYEKVPRRLRARLCAADSDRHRRRWPAIRLGTSVSLSEAEVHWREFLAFLRERGLHGVETGDQ